MAESEDGFLKRWARRKEEAREARAPEEPPTPAAAEEGAAAPSEQRSEEEIVASLPDIDSLDENSDFSVFMQKGVPAELRRLALRKLWRLNPILGLRDGLNDYDLDYRAMDKMVGGVVKTVYQVGKGMVSPEREEKDDAAPGVGVSQSDSESERVADGEAALPDDSQAGKPQPLSDQGQAKEAPVPEDTAAEPRSQGEARPLDSKQEGETPSAKPTSGSAAARRWGRFNP